MTQKLIDFIEAVLPNQDHVAYTLGLRKNAAMQYYALNVKTFNTVAPAEFEEAIQNLYGPPLRMIKEVQARCEALAEQAGVKVEDLTNAKMFEIMLSGLKEKAAESMAEAVKPAAVVTETKTETVIEAGMVTCPECGKKFPMPGGDAKAA